MAKRQVFFSFEYNKDAWRAAQVRNMGKVSEDSTFSGNDWEEVKRKDDQSIKKWINDQMAMRSCIVVLVGATTYTRKWVKYEVQRAYDLNKGIVAICVHNLRDREGNQTIKGQNPLDYVFTSDGISLSKYCMCFDSKYTSSKSAYADIENHIQSLIEYAISHKAP